MKKTVSTSAAPARPISRQAYIRLITRIGISFGMESLDEESIRLMMESIDRYMAGDRQAGETLPLHLRLAFRFLCHDIDSAMERSRKARERARSRRKKTSAEQPADNRRDTPQPSHEESAEESACECESVTDTPCDDGIPVVDVDEKTFLATLSRRERRAWLRSHSPASNRRLVNGRVKSPRKPGNVSR